MNHRLNTLFPAWGLFEQLQDVCRSDAPPLQTMSADSDHAYVDVALPGVDADDIDVTLEQDVLTISAKRSAPELADDVQRLRQERGFREFSRSYRLPFAADVAGIEAELRTGVLYVRVPRAEQAKPAKIAVLAAG